MPPATCKDLCIDAADPVRLGAFWGALLGWELRVPEPRTVKNRLHLLAGPEGNECCAFDRAAP